MSNKIALSLIIFLAKVLTPTHLTLCRPPNSFPFSFFLSFFKAHFPFTAFVPATVRNAQGGLITNAAGEVAGPLEYGSGHLRPTHASDPGLVYETSYGDYLLFACSSIGVQMDPTFPCPDSPPSTFNLNYPSVSVSNLNGSITVHRTVTNVGQWKARYRVSIVEPSGVSVKISPQILEFKEVGEEKSFRIKLRVDGRKGAGSREYMAGSYTWSDGTHDVRSPIVVSIA